MTPVCTYLDKNILFGNPAGCSRSFGCKRGQNAKMPGLASLQAIPSVLEGFTLGKSSHSRYVEGTASPCSCKPLSLFLSGEAVLWRMLCLKCWLLVLLSSFRVDVLPQSLKTLISERGMDVACLFVAMEVNAGT